MTPDEITGIDKELVLPATLYGVAYREIQYARVQAVAIVESPDLLQFPHPHAPITRWRREVRASSVATSMCGKEPLLASAPGRCLHLNSCGIRFGAEAPANHPGKCRYRDYREAV
jgi:hypothetical protein